MPFKCRNGITNTAGRGRALATVEFFENIGKWLIGCKITRGKFSQWPAASDIWIAHFLFIIHNYLVSLIERIVN